MPNSTFNLDQFRTTVLSQTGLARTNRFEVTIVPPLALNSDHKESSLVSIFVEQTNMPMFNINTKPYKIFGPTYQRPVSSEYGGEGISMVFHVDSDMVLKRFFDDWMHLVVDRNFYVVNYQDQYVTDIIISQLNEQDEITYSVKLIEAFPKNMNLMELNNASTNQTHRLNVLFGYRYWIDVQDTTSQLRDVVRPIQIPQIPNIDTRPITPNQFNWQTGELGAAPGSDLPPAA